jgi:20S proteasome subunit beta 6
MSLTVAQTAPLRDARESAWSPYDNNGGTVCAVTGADFIVVGADTRMSTGYGILSRNVPKCIQLTSKCVLATAGMQADQQALHKQLVARLEWYKHQTGKEMSTKSIGQLLSNTLYGRRQFPFYTFNVLAGIDSDGTGIVFSYDAVGSFERQKYSATGTGASLVIPMLDSQVGWKNVYGLDADIALDTALDVVKDSMTSAGERDIYTGDSVDIFIIRDDGIKQEKLELKKD